MGMLSQLRSWLFPASSNETASWLAAAGYSPQREGQLPVPSTDELASIAAIQAAIGAISSSLSSVDWSLVSKPTSGGRIKVRGSDAASAMADWSVREKEAWLRDACTYGEAFAVLRRNMRGGVDHLQRIEPERVSLVVADSGEVFYKLTERADLAYRAEEISESDMVHLRYLTSRHHPLMGASPLSTVAGSLDLVYQIRETGRTLYKNASRVNAIVSHPKNLSVEATTRLKQSFQNATTGSHGFEAVILQEGMTAETLNPAKMMDLQMAEMMSLSVRLVAQAFAVPPSFLGEIENISYASSAEQTRSFVRHCLKPWGSRISDALARSLLTREQRVNGLGVDVDLASLLRGDGRELSDSIGSLLNSGAISANESRDWLGLVDIENEAGEALRVPGNLMHPDNWALPAKGKVDPMAVQRKRFQRANQ